jgi:hypothetical protein
MYLRTREGGGQSIRMMKTCMERFYFTFPLLTFTFKEPPPCNSVATRRRQRKRKVHATQPRQKRESPTNTFRFFSCKIHGTIPLAVLPLPTPLPLSLSFFCSCLVLLLDCLVSSSSLFYVYRWGEGPFSLVYRKTQKTTKRRKKEPEAKTKTQHKRQ